MRRKKKAPRQYKGMRKPPKGAPVLRGWLLPYGAQVKVYCPYCNDCHYHGVSEDELSHGRISHRTAHCRDHESPFHKGGYYIGLVRKKDIADVDKAQPGTTIPEHVIARAVLGVIEMGGPTNRQPC